MGGRRQEGDVLACNDGSGTRSAANQKRLLGDRGRPRTGHEAIQPARSADHGKTPERWSGWRAAVCIVFAGAWLAIFLPPAASAKSTTLSWLAAGDSYSAGEGLPHATGHCAQATPGSGSEAWPFVAHEDLGNSVPTLASPTFTACTGATTNQFFHSVKIKYYLEHITLPAEWQPSMGKFDLVTFTFGGNDVGFPGVIQQCVSKPALRLSCPSDSLLRGRIANFGQSYKSFLTKVANKAVAPGGNVLVLGYPELIEDPSLWSARSRVLG